ncbi:MAG: accessory gene regulator B family protein [Lachnospiraceae bacterium]|nr:accessory gene regulator B family protein [Lachnospiraceae bacterium]
MISKPANYITSLMKETGTIRSEEVEIFNYLLSWIFENITYFVFFIIFGIFFRDILYGILLYAVLMPLRCFGGGAHRSSGVNGD